MSDSLPVKISDQQLLQLLRESPEEGFSYLLQSYGRLIHYVVSGFVHKKMDREDLFQEVIVSLWENGCRRLTQWESRTAFSSYLFIVVWRLCVDIKKKMDYQESFLRCPSQAGESEEYLLENLGEASPTQRSNLAYSELIEQVGICFDALIESKAARESDRLLVILRAEGHAAREVGESLCMEENLVHRRFNRICQRLRDCLEKKGFKKISDWLSDFSPPDRYIQRLLKSTDI